MGPGIRLSGIRRALAWSETMQRMLRGAGMAIVILSSIATAFAARDRGALFWGSIATTVGAAVVLWRILNERGAE